MRLIPLIAMGFLLFACNQQPVQEAVTSPSFDSSYIPARFSDPQRLEKIKAVFPIIDSLYVATARAQHFPGLAFGVVVDGELVHTGNYGYTDIAKKIPVTSSSMFRIASMSKSFTAMAILQLRDAGRLNLDDPAAKYIPELNQLKYPTADAPLITIRHLLTHGSGFPEDNPWGDRQLSDSDRELLDFIKNQPSFSNPPGLAYEYSNLGFALLGRIVTVVSGQPYQTYIREHILNPLQMRGTTYEYDSVPANQLAHGYRWLNNQWNEESLLHDKPDGSWGAMGGMISSVEEFSHYMAAHLRAWPPSNEPDNGPLKRSSIREMQYPWRFNGLNPNYHYSDGRSCPVASAYGYGLGWLRDCNGRVYIAHSGGLPGFGSQWRIMPDYGIGVIAFANRTYAGLGNINLQVLDTLIKTAMLEPRRLPASEILTKRKYELIKLLPNWEAAEQSGLFAENFFADYPIDSLKKEARDLFGKVGKILKVGDMQAENQLRGSFILEGEKGKLRIYFTLSPENPPRIQEYHIWLEK